MKNPDKLRVWQKDALETLRKNNRKTARVYQMKLVLKDIFDNVKDPEVAEMGVKKWLSWAVRSRLEPIKSCARTVKNHFHGIMRYFKSGLTNGPVEGINSRIQEARRRANPDIS